MRDTDKLAKPNQDFGQTLVKAAQEVQAQKEQSAVLAKVTRFLACVKEADGAIARGQFMKKLYQEKIAALEAGEFEYNPTTQAIVFHNRDLNADY
jgi:hypothetical protein